MYRTYIQYDYLWCLTINSARRCFSKPQPFAFGTFLTVRPQVDTTIFTNREALQNHSTVQVNYYCRTSINVLNDWAFAKPLLQCDFILTMPTGRTSPGYIQCLYTCHDVTLIGLVSILFE